MVGQRKKKYKFLKITHTCKSLQLFHVGEVEVVVVIDQVRSLDAVEWCGSDEEVMIR